MSGFPISFPSLATHHRNHAVTHIGIQCVGQIAWYGIQAGSVFTSSVTGNDQLAIIVSLFVLGLGIAKAKDWLKL